MARPPLTGTAGPKAEFPRFPDGQPREAQPRWRQDFPIDSPEDTYVSRRDFAKFMVLTSGAFVAGQAWIAAQAAVEEPAGGPEVAVAALADVPVGGVVPFRYPSDQDPCLLIRLGEDALVAFSQRCTHLSCAVQPRVGEGKLLCPCHEGVFDLHDGVPLSGPPRRPLPRITLAVRDGTVYATGVQLRV